MKIIDIGICIDNVDPKGIGRIRCTRFSESISEKENAIEYEAFSKNDPFLLNPFLPVTINHIPEIGQAVKIINYDTNKETINQEYIAGPFNNLGDIANQTFSGQVENTTYGNSVKEKKHVFDVNGNYRDKNSEGFFHKKTHSGIYGKKSSDLIFTERGLILRGGKTPNTNNMSPKNRKNNIDSPIMSKNVPRIVIEKFDKKLTLESTIKDENTMEIGKINTLLEYDIDSFENPTKIKYYLYKNNSSNPLYNSINFKIDTEIINGDFTSYSKETDPFVYEISVDSIDDIGFEVNDFIYKLYKGDVNEILKNEYVPSFPLYFRPTKRTLIDTSNINKKMETLNKIDFFGVGPVGGMVWSKNNIRPEVTTNKVKQNVLKADESAEESFQAVIADKIFILSTDTNNTEKSIDFNKISNYDITHENFKIDIEPNTYSLVRGENLIKVLKSIVNVLLTHQHNVVGSMVQNENYGEYMELMDYIKKIEEDVLNKSVKIN